MRFLFAVLVTVLASPALGDETGEPAYIFGDPITVSDAEAAQIQLQLIERYPFLASSEGIKAIQAQLSMRAPAEAPETRKPAVMAYVYFYPYAQSHGISQGALATCWRWPAQKHWECPTLESRNYVSLETQEFEVRVSDDISLEVVKTLFEVTRKDLPVLIAEGENKPEALLTVSHSYGDKYLVTWGTDEGYGAILFKAELLDSAHPTLVESWRAVIVKPGDEI